MKAVRKYTELRKSYLKKIWRTEQRMILNEIDKKQLKEHHLYKNNNKYFTLNFLGYYVKISFNRTKFLFTVFHSISTGQNYFLKY